MPIENLVVDMQNDGLLLDNAYDVLKRAIITHELVPGTKVSENRLASVYGFGKAAIRVSLRRLCGEGLIISEPRCKHQIAPIILGEVQNLFDLRNMLEPAAARDAAGRVDVNKLHELNKKCEEGYILGDSESEYCFLLANKNFHMEIAAAADNPRQAVWISQLQDAVFRILFPLLQTEDQTARWKHGHGEIIEALSSGNKFAAEQAALGHLLDGQQRTMSVLIKRLEFSDLSQINNSNSGAGKNI